VDTIEARHCWTIGREAVRKASDQGTCKAARNGGKDAAWRAEFRDKRPFLGRVATAITPKPSVGQLSHATTAWDKGAAGERQVAAILDGLSGVEVLHDRLVPGKGAANIDHIVIGQTGVFVIDAKNYGGVLEVRQKGTMFRPTERLYVAGRDRTNLTEDVASQVQAVSAALGTDWAHVPVYAMLCFVGCKWTREKPKSLNNVTVVWPVYCRSTC
jgi:hypothetical protein